MPQIDELWDKYKGETAYIIGTGPSMAFFSQEYLTQLRQTAHVTIGLNRAFRYENWKYMLSIHPEVISERPNLNWITKRKHPEKFPQLSWADYYCFRNNTTPQSVDYIKKTSGCLYVGRGIHTSAITLAAQMGCKHAIMLGVDCNHISFMHHGKPQSTEFKNLSPAVVYKEYYDNAVLVRELVYKQYGMEILSLQPYLGIGYHKQESVTLSQLYSLQLPQESPPDTSKYKRDNADVF